jgi:hypothetical protein
LRRLWYRPILVSKIRRGYFRDIRLHHHAGPQGRESARYQARGDLYGIADDLEFIKAQLARVPTRGELARTALGIIVASAALVILWAEAFWRLAY